MSFSFSKKLAGIAGLLYLAVILFGVFAEVYVRGELLVPGNAAETITRLQADPGWFRLGFVSDLLMITAFFLLPLPLYRLLRPIQRELAATMVLCVLVSVAVMCANMLNHFAILLVLDPMNAPFAPEQTQSLVRLFAELHKNGYRIAQIFFGLWLLPLGILSWRSGFVPRWIAISLVVACFSFLLDFFLFFLLPGYSAETSSWVTLPTVIGEFSFCGWLLIQGISYIPGKK
ncbi:DUF4386 domain-containing protein [Flavilitoribacter nigricans]|uniref:DUF4386 domain-containing protein n=1 Tax=Flavilitoribacter nigricans (strain ATCC 23147 / DSM 23189 / NBRC 102662 / NCIMB 1420 / SS-2) TaxID=1122177 RepID=A0A2D0NHA2_FLAN2|nr:DUF4386 domain-containing protein [Flavilitoribacter nigricans]PHN07766.1 hypothetical protein CRP01_04805 [Flavilitoribacter nigricans DSM 23189 = NBRC 102662]